MKIEKIAQVCHEVNKVYCESIGDFSQPDWQDAEQWQKDSCIKGVEYHLENPDSKPEDSHICWLKEKQSDGWKYGEVKDVTKKEHPCFVQYSDLPLEQRAKDHIFTQIVKSLK